jgi:hypothetical protein
VNIIYQIEYYNEVWKDWLRFSPWAFSNKEEAEKALEQYKTSYPDNEYKIAKYEEPKQARVKNLGRKITTEKT